MIRVMLCDDHEVVREGIAGIVNRQADMRVVAESGDAAEIQRFAADISCDVLVLDLGLPGTEGTTLLAKVRERTPDLHVVVLSMQSEGPVALHCLDLGASAFLSKERSPAELLEAVRCAARGERYITERLAALAADRARGCASDAPHTRLSAREYQVFCLVIRGTPPSQIADELNLSRPTVSNHIHSVKQKLGAATNGEVVLYAHRAGLLA